MKQTLHNIEQNYNQCINGYVEKCFDLLRIITN